MKKEHVWILVIVVAVVAYWLPGITTLFPTTGTPTPQPASAGNNG